MTILNNIKLSYEYIGYNTRDNMAKMNDYKVTLKYNKKQLTVDYSIGSALNESDINVKSVMSALLLDMVECDFNEFCDNFGYDNDSIKALNIYKQCEKIMYKMNKMFSASELNEMRELLTDY